MTAGPHVIRRLPTPGLQRSQLKQTMVSTPFLQEIQS